MRKTITIIAVIALIACTVLYAFCFENVQKAKDIALRPGNQAVPGIEPHVLDAQAEGSMQAETLQLTPEALHAFEDATAGLEGISYTPEAFLGSRTVADNAGMDYGFLCFVQEEGVAPYYAALTIFEYPDGKTRIVKVEKQETHSSSEVMAYSDEKGIDDYDMADILANPDLIEQYKQAHPYLDDMNYFPVEGAKVVQEIGYSRIWQVMEVRTAAENGGEEVHLFENIPHILFEDFRDASDVDAYYLRFIKKYQMEG